MTTRIDILNETLNFDTGVYPSILSSEMSMTNPKNQLCVVLPYPSGSDVGFHVAFEIPQNYSSSPVISIRGVISGTPANVFAVAAVLLQRADSDAVDTAYEAEDTASNSTWTGYADKDEYGINITLTPSASLVAGRTLYLYIYRDDSVDTTTWNFLMTHCMFQYTEG